MSDLSKSLINQFASLNKEKNAESKSTTLYGTVKMDGDKLYVRIDGSDVLTPCQTSVSVKHDERVRVTIQNHEAVIVGNMTSVGARVGDVEDAKNEVIETIGDNIEQYIDPYDEKYQQMQQLAANTLGFYYSEEKDANGATISYRHDKPTLAESTIIYKNGIDGFFLATDGGQTWKAVFDSNGDAVLNILYAIGIQAKWINTRGLKAVDNNGNRTFEIDADTGKCYVTPAEFFLGDQTIGDMIAGLDPNMEISKSGNTVTISYIDKNGNRQEYTVKDGQNGSDGSTPSLTSYQIWQLLLQTNTDFIYRGSDNKLYIQASHIDTGDFCGFQVSRTNKTIKNSVTGSNDSNDEDDSLIDLSVGGGIEINASVPMMCTTPPTTVYGEYSTAMLKRDRVYATQAHVNRLFVRPRSSGSSKSKFALKATVNTLGNPCVYMPATYGTQVNSGKTMYMGSDGYIATASASSKRYKRDINYDPDINFDLLFDTPICTYKYNHGYFVDDPTNDDVYLGFIAEELDKVNRFIVDYDSEGRPDSWQERMIIPFMVGAMKNDHKRVLELEEMVKNQQEQINELKDLIKTLNDVIIKQTYKSNN